MEDWKRGRQCAEQRAGIDCADLTIEIHFGEGFDNFIQGIR
jgi:hypothetical protein